MNTRLAVAVAIPVIVVSLAGCTSPSADTSSPPVAVASPSPSPSTLLRAPTPDPDTVTGAFAPDLPAVLAGVPDGSTVLVSSAKADGDQLQVAVSFTSPQTTDQIVAWYDQRLGAAGFTATDPATAEPTGARVRAYLRSDGAEYLSLAIVDQSTRRDATIGGVMNPDPPAS